MKRYTSKGCLAVSKICFQFNSCFELNWCVQCKIEKCVMSHSHRLSVCYSWSKPPQDNFSLDSFLNVDFCPVSVCPECPVNSLSTLALPPGAAGGGVPDAAAAETERATAPHTDRSTHLHSKFTHDCPVTQLAVLCYSFTTSGQPGRKPLWSAGQRTSQTSESYCRSSHSDCICCNVFSFRNLRDIV